MPTSPTPPRSLSSSAASLEEGARPKLPLATETRRRWHLSFDAAPLAILAATLLVCAYFVAFGATRLAALAWLDVQPQGSGAVREVSSEPDARSEHARSAVRRAQGILARNIFDSELGPLWPPEPEAEPDELEPEGEAADPNAPLPVCDSSVRMVGALYFGAAPERSLVSIEAGKEPARLLRQGMEVDGHRVEEVFPRLTVLSKQDGDLCTLALFDEEEAAKDDRSKGKAAKRKERKRKRSKRYMRRIRQRNAGMTREEVARYIDRVDGNTYRVDRAFVDKLTSNQASLIGVAKLQPVREGGRRAGVRLTRFRSRDLLGQLGLRSGDVLRTINGYDMTNADAALEAYVRLKQSDHLTLQVLRKGKPTTIEYHIQ